MYRLLAEKLMNEHLPMRPQASDQKLYWLERGVQMEPIAIKAFEQEVGARFEPVGFIESPHKRLGCSPDGLVAGKNEGIEIKAPAPWTHVEYLMEGPGNDYKPQVQGQLIVGQFDCVHFFSFHPRMPQKHVLTLPDLSYQATLRQALDDFLGELDEKYRKAKELGVFIRAEEIFGS